MWQFSASYLDTNTSRKHKVWILCFTKKTVICWPENGQCLTSSTNFARQIGPIVLHFISLVQGLSLHSLNVNIWCKLDEKFILNSVCPIFFIEISCLRPKKPFLTFSFPKTIIRLICSAKKRNSEIQNFTLSGWRHLRQIEDFLCFFFTNLRIRWLCYARSFRQNIICYEILGFYPNSTIPENLRSL